MKRLLFYLSIPLFFIAGCKTAAQRTERARLGLPGDNLSLYAVLKLFQESPTLEGFERSLNDSSKKINNLDLNGDNKVDYIRVIDSVEGDVHNIILRAVLSKEEEQNVAVIVVNKLKDGSAYVQVVGDEDLYGKDYIIEPNYKKEYNQGVTPNPAYAEDAEYDNEVVYVETTPFEIAAWPILTFMYGPGYTIWYSPWYWGFYPVYWIPWTPFYWHYYYGYHYYWNYYYFGHYRRWHNYRTPGWRDSYYGGTFYRPKSTIYRQRINRGDFRATYTRPSMAADGGAYFRRSFPKAPSVNNRLPGFNRKGSPVFERRGYLNPTIQRQIKPGQRNPSSKNPSTKSGIVRPPKQPSKKSGNE